MEDITIKEEPIFENLLNETLKLDMKKEISNLFEELDMMNLQDYDQNRVERFQRLFEQYLEEQLETKENELNNLKQGFEKANFANLELCQKINEYEKSLNELELENISLKTKITEETKFLMSINENDKIKPFSCKYSNKTVGQVKDGSRYGRNTEADFRCLSNYEKYQKVM